MQDPGSPTRPSPGCVSLPEGTRAMENTSSAPQVQLTPRVFSRILNGVISATKSSTELSSIIHEWVSSGFPGAAGSPPDTGEASYTPAHCLNLATLYFGPQNPAIQLIKLVIGICSLRERPSDVQASPTDIGTAWQLIYEALTTGSPIGSASRSAQGFLSVALCSLIVDNNIDELWRLHVWLPDGMRGNEDYAIHSHQPFAQSWILAGEGIDHTYQVTGATDAASATHATYRLSWDDGKSSNTTYKTHQISSTIVNSGELVSASLIRSEPHARNSTYTIPSAAFHRSEVSPEDFHATLFVFDSARGFLKDAPVLGPKEGHSLTQTRASPGTTPAVLAEVTNAIRSWEELFREGQEYAQRAQWENALRSFDNALYVIDAHKSSAIPTGQYRSLVLAELGNTNRRFGRYEQAEHYLLSALEGMELSLRRVELGGELGVVYRHMNRLDKAKCALEDQYRSAQQLQADQAMCRAVGNLGMVNYQLFQQTHEPELLELAIQQQLERIQLAKKIMASLEVECQDVDNKKHIRSATTWESIGLSRLSLCYVAKKDSARAIASAKEALDLTKNSEDVTMTAMGRFFYGHALLSAGMTADAVLQFNIRNSCTPAMAFCKEPSEEHRTYLQELIDAGADLDITDEQGYTALDYAVFSGDAATETVVVKGLRHSIENNVEDEIETRLMEAYVRKSYRELFQERLRPILLRKDREMFRGLRKAYAEQLATDEKKRQMFDGLRFLYFPDFVECGRLPRSSENLTQRYDTGVANTDSVDYLIFVSYRWINTLQQRTASEPQVKLSPDDGNNTQYRRMLSAIESFLEKHPNIRPEKLGVWVDYSCVNQDAPLSGVQALPMILIQCDAMISIVDEDYYSRAWCSVEVMLMQTIKKTYGLHLWYEQVAAAPEPQDDTSLRHKYALREGDIDLQIVLAEKHLSLETDRRKIYFLERQIKLLR